jgi:hypothetical protein
MPMTAAGIEPDWTRATHWIYKGDRVTEVPAVPTSPVRYFTLIEERGDTVSLSVQEPHTRIRVIESPNNKETFGFVITLLPDENYEGDLWMLDSDPSGSDYTGITLYSQLDGTPMWGWRYVEGESVNTILFDTEYADQADPDVSIRMGIRVDVATRAVENQGQPELKDPNDPESNEYIYIDQTVVNAYKNRSHLYIYLSIPGGFRGGGSGPKTPSTSGAGGSSGSSNSSPSDTSKADEVFDDVEDEYVDDINDLLEEIMLDCMGGKLFNALEARGDDIILNVDIGNGNSKYGSSGIKLTQLNSGTLLHEMFHAYQHGVLGTTAFNARIANNEVEAYLARYMFTGNTVGVKYGAEIKELAWYVNKDGTVDPDVDFLFFDAYEKARDAIIAGYAADGIDITYDRNFNPLESIGNNMQGISSIYNLKKDCK